MVRFNTVVPLFKAKKIWLPKDMDNSELVIEAKDELKNASAGGFKSKHDDFIDTVSMLSSLQVWKPSEEIAYELNVAKGTSMWVELEDEGESFRNSLIF